MSEIKHLFWDDKFNNKKITKKSVRARPNAKDWVPILDCRHWRQRFELKEGIVVYASSFFDRPEHSDRFGDFVGDPDIGFYLDERWTSGKVLVSPGLKLPFQPARQHDAKVMLWPWADYGVPEDVKLLTKALRWLLREAKKDQVVEIGCMGGHGRTGTTLACMLVLQGMNPSEAIRRVRRRYCPEGVESVSQESFVRLCAR